MRKVKFIICVLYLTACLIILSVILINVVDAKVGHFNTWNEIDGSGVIIVICEGEYFSEDEDFKQVHFAWDLGIAGQYFCPVCQEKGLKSRAYYKYSTRTLMGWETYWDEEGNYHSEDPNHTTSYFYCSLGHEWHEVDYGAGKTGYRKITKDTEDEPEIIIEFDLGSTSVIDLEADADIDWRPEFDSRVDWSKEEKATQLRELEEWKAVALKDIYERLDQIEELIFKVIEALMVPELELDKDAEGGD